MTTIYIVKCSEKTKLCKDEDNVFNIDDLPNVEEVTPEETPEEIKEINPADYPCVCYISQNENEAKNMAFTLNQKLQLINYIDKNPDIIIKIIKQDPVFLSILRQKVWNKLDKIPSEYVSITTKIE
jgi:hypothetical protein